MPTHASRQNATFQLLWKESPSYFGERLKHTWRETLQVEWQSIVEKRAITRVLEKYIPQCLQIASKTLKTKVNDLSVYYIERDFILPSL